MKILIDMQSMQSGSSKGGIGRYSYNLLEAITRNNTTHEICILLNKNLPMHSYSKLTSIIDEKKIYMFTTLGDTQESIKANHFRSESSKLTREYAISLIDPDVLFIMSLFEGLGESVITSVGELFPANRTAVILYDLIPLVEKDKYLISPMIDKHYMSKIFYLIQSGVLLSISQFSKDEAMSVLKLPEQQIINISSAIDDKFKKFEVSKENKSQLFKKYGIKNRFLMFTGSFDLRKNQEYLIRAFASIDKETREGYQLLIIGGGSDIVVNKIKSVIKQTKLKQNDVLFLGHISDVELVNLYNLCSLFVFPSLREGFGLPVLEAMACGVPTIGSNTTSIPEVINRKDALFNPKSIEDIASKINQVLKDDNFAKTLTEHGLSQSKNFSWDISAQKTLKALEALYHDSEKESLEKREVYSKLIQKISKIENITAVHDNDIIRLSNRIEKDRKKYKKNIKQVGVITTWNSRCGIASYSNYLTQSFRDNALILAPYIDAKLLISPDDKNTIRSWHLFDDNLEHLLSTIFDNRLTTVLIEFNYGLFNFNHLNSFIENLLKLDIEVYITLHSTVDDTNQEKKQLKILKKSLEKATQIFIHTQKDIENLNRIGISTNITLFNQGMVDIKPKDNSIYKNGTFKISTYGFFLESKGLIQIIKAMKILIDQGEDISLLMLNAKYSDVGSSHLIDEANALIKEYNLETKIILNTNYLDDTESINYLAQTDLVVFPYQNTNESSSAAVRMAIATKQHIAVTPQPIFDEISDFVFKFRGDSVEDIALGLKDAINSIKIRDKSLEIMSKKRNAWIDIHLYSKLSNKLKDIILKK